MENLASSLTGTDASALDGTANDELISPATLAHVLDNRPSPVPGLDDVGSVVAYNTSFDDVTFGETRTGGFVGSSVGSGVTLTGTWEARSQFNNTLSGILMSATWVKIA